MTFGKINRWVQLARRRATKRKHYLVNSVEAPTGGVSWILTIVAIAMVIALVTWVGRLDSDEADRRSGLRSLHAHIEQLQQGLIECETALSAYIITVDRRFLDPKFGCGPTARIPNGILGIVAVSELGNLARSVEQLLSDIGAASLAAIEEERNDAPPQFNGAEETEHRRGL